MYRVVEVNGDDDGFDSQLFYTQGRAKDFIIDAYLGRGYEVLWNDDAVIVLDGQEPMYYYIVKEMTVQ